MGYRRFKAQFGAAVRNRRLALGKTQPDIAEAVDGLDQGGLSRLERGLQGFDSDTLYQLALALELPVYELFGGKIPTGNAQALPAAALAVAEAWAKLGARERETVNVVLKALANGPRDADMEKTAFNAAKKPAKQ
jgi:transcriptional regulator with XRE-family HTH domain